MKIGIIGAGVMGGMIAKRCAQAGHDVLISDISTERLDKAKNKLDIKTTTNNADVIEHSEIVLLAVKPQQFDSVLDGLKPIVEKQTVLISMLAGVEMWRFTDKLGKVKIARIMPNLPISMGKGVVGLSFSGELTEYEQGQVQTLLNSLGTVAVVPENLIDAVTALSGSGPAFIFLMIEAMADAGVKLGFKFDQALDMTLSVFEGSAALVRESKMHPAELKAMVSSPAGTTVEGLNALERGSIRATIADAVIQAYKRAKEL